MSSRHTPSSGDYNGSVHITNVLQNSTGALPLSPCSFTAQGSNAQGLLPEEHLPHSDTSNEELSGSFSDERGIFFNLRSNSQQAPGAYMAQKTSHSQANKVIQQTGPSRRAQNTSQGTVIVSRNIYGQRQKQFGLQADAASVDDTRLQAERNYYERLDSKGIIRRRSMTKSISHDDCLFGRGVNPRTGIVTPAGGAATAEIDSNAALHIQSTKWRQQGNQWVSLSIDEPTPGSRSTSMPKLLLPKTRKVQIPERLRELKADVDRHAPSEFDRLATLNGVSDDVLETPGVKLKPDVSMPGSYPQASEKQNIQHYGTTSASHTPVRRKPLASKAVRAQHVEYGNVVHTQSDQSPYKSSPDSPDDASRSFSAPVPKRVFYCPSDLDEVTDQSAIKAAPKSEGRRAEPDFRAGKSFLGPRPQGQIDHSHLLQTGQSASKLNLDKELPCLPMSNGPYPQARSTSNPLTFGPSKLDPTAVTTHRQAPQNPMAFRRPEMPNTHTLISPVRGYPLSQPQQGRGTDFQTTCGISAVPIYDNPPNMPKPSPTRQRIRGPRLMPLQPRSIDPGKILDHLVDPFNTTFMSTDTSTHLHNKPGIQQSLNSFNSMSTFLTTSGSTIPHHQQNTNSTSRVPPSSVIVQVKSRPAPSIRPRGPLRPQMPLRTTDIRDVPRTIKPQDIRNITPMDPQVRSNMTGMLQMSDTDVDITNRSDEPNSVRRNKINEANSREIAMPSKDHGKSVFNESMRKCSHCQNGLVARVATGPDGQKDSGLPRRLSTTSANAPEVAVSLKKMTAKSSSSSSHVVTRDHSCKLPSGSSSGVSSATILDVEEDLRDHSICCPECCKTGCHEGCMGHKITSSNLEQLSQRSRRRADSSSTLVSSSCESLNSNTSGISPGKLSFIKSALRAPFKHKRSIDTLSNMSDTIRNRQTRSPATPATTFNNNSALWSGSDGASGFFGAVAAAKRAIGFDSFDASQENGLNQFMTPKKRSKARDVSVQCTSEQDIKVSALTPTASPVLSSIKSVTTASESRKVNSSRPCSANQPTIALDHPQRRTASAMSNSSTEIQMPAMSSMSLKGMFEMIMVVPMEATRMCIRNNPEIMSFGWVMLNHACTWACVITATGHLILNAVYIYSKTGKMKLRKADGSNIGVVDFLRNCLRSALYLVIFFSLTVIAGKILRFLLWPLKILCTVGKYVMLGSKRTRVL